MGSESKVFTLAEVSEHKSPKDCWLIIDGKEAKIDFFQTCGESEVQMGSTPFMMHNESVLYYAEILNFIEVYDVTKFLEDHPGGDEVLLSATGKDATDDFEDVGHSSSARAMMDEMYVGDIDTATIPTKTKYTPPKQPQYNQDKTSDFVMKLLQFLVPLIILGLAVGVRFYTKSESA